MGNGNAFWCGIKDIEDMMLGVVSTDNDFSIVLVNEMDALLQRLTLFTCLYCWISHFDRYKVRIKMQRIVFLKFLGFLECMSFGCWWHYILRHPNKKNNKSVKARRQWYGNSVLAVRPPVVVYGKLRLTKCSDRCRSKIHSCNRFT